MSEFTGYAIDHERKDLLIQKSTPFLHIVSGNYDPHRYAAGIDARKWMRTENQGQVGRCAGYSQATTGECLFRIKTGEIIQFNGHYSYLRAQKIDGLLGRDQGSTIHGECEAQKKWGTCPIDWDGDGRDDYPPPDHYTTDIPQGADEKAAEYLLGYYSILHNRSELTDFMRSGQGAVTVGARWGNWGPDSRGVCDSFTGGRGGHAWCILDWDDTLYGGVHWMLNSHGIRWGLNGWAMLTNRFLDQLFEDSYTSVAGVSDLKVPEVRHFSWLDDHYLD